MRSIVGNKENPVYKEKLQELSLLYLGKEIRQNDLGWKGLLEITWSKWTDEYGNSLPVWIGWRYLISYSHQ